jgi:hypothetical protein
MRISGEVIAWHSATVITLPLPRASPCFPLTRVCHVVFLKRIPATTSHMIAGKKQIADFLVGDGASVKMWGNLFWGF